MHVHNETPKPLRLSCVCVTLGSAGTLFREKKTCREKSPTLCISRVIWSPPYPTGVQWRWEVARGSQLMKRANFSLLIRRGFGICEGSK
jgi:hypothetical protein